MELNYLIEDYSDEVCETLETLKEFHSKVYSNIIDHLTSVGGECSSYSSTLIGEGFPYDYLLYAKESLDPVVQVLYRLYKNIEATFNKIKELNKVE